MVLHIACSEIKDAAVKNLYVIARIAKNAIGDRKKHSGLMVEFILKKYGFFDPRIIEDRFDKTMFEGFKVGSTFALGHHDMPLYTILIVHDEAFKATKRSIPITMPSREAVFLWDNGILVWAEANEQLLNNRRWDIL